MCPCARRLVHQLENGSDKAMGMAASGLALISLKSAEHRATVTQELVKLLASNNEAVRQRASEALRDMAEDEGSKAKKNVTAGGGAPLVNLLKDGLKDGRVEAQEYALWSLSALTGSPSSWHTEADAIVNAGGIKPLIAALQGGKLSHVAQEHAAAVLSGIAPLGVNALAIRNANGIDPLVLLLSQVHVHGGVWPCDHVAMRMWMCMSTCAAPPLGLLTTWHRCPHADAHMPMPTRRCPHADAHTADTHRLVLGGRQGNVEAKEHAADALAQLAVRAEASLEIAKAGAVSAFVKCALATLAPGRRLLLG